MLGDFTAKVERFCFRKLRKFLAKKGYYLGFSTSKSQIQKFITNIKPYSTNLGLIRIGSKGDGGYLVPNDLEGIEACFSPGVGSTSNFEEACQRYGMKTFLADASVNSLPTTNQDLHFTQKYIGAFNDTEFMTLDTWVESAKLNANSDLLLQMDIEGAEYEVLLNVSEKLLARFRIIVMEIHYLDRLASVDFHQMATTAFNKILINHTCVHIHPNNVDVIHTINDVPIAPTIEITFVRNDRIKTKQAATQFPHHLDADNMNKQKVVLPQNWYQN